MNFVCVPSVEAGIFSFVGKIFGAGEEEPVSIVPNSQTALLLKPALNTNPASALGGGGITIVNQSALLPDTGPLGSIADIEENKGASDRISIYVVRGGDSLSEIAKMFNVSVNTIVWANDIERGDLIKSGQILAILPVTGVKYTIKEGDTLQSIVKKYGGDIDEIAEYNSLSKNEKLAAGVEIIIPDGEAAYQPAPQYSSQKVQGIDGQVYSGYYARPVQGGNKSQGLHGYNAVDLATYCGAPILAAASGDVVIARSSGWNGGYGKYVVISHLNGTQTLYAHNSENIVTPGWHVVRGQVIGYVGATGKSTGCHVHFEVRGAKQPF